MKINAESFRIPKAGCTEAEYEDACSPVERVETAHQFFRFAIADGATDSSFSGIWARLLVKAFAEHSDLHPEENFTQTIHQIVNETRPKWQRDVGQRELPWYAAEKAESGAFSSLLGLTIRDQVDQVFGEWQAVAVGDSCLVQVRKNEVIANFPIDHSSRFNLMPFLIASNSSYDTKCQEHIKVRKGDIQVDDSFYLMTDALACWFMTEHEKGNAPWERLRDLGTSDHQESFRQMIENLRADRSLKNDDCTLMRIEIVEA